MNEVLISGAAAIATQSSAAREQIPTKILLRLDVTVGVAVDLTMVIQYLNPAGGWRDWWVDAVAVTAVGNRGVLFGDADDADVATALAEVDAFIKAPLPESTWRAQVRHGNATAATYTLEALSASTD